MVSTQTSSQIERTTRSFMFFVACTLVLAYWANGIAALRNDLGPFRKLPARVQNHDVHSAMLRLLLWPMNDPAKDALAVIVGFSMFFAVILGLGSLLIPTTWAALLALPNVVGTVRLIRRIG